MYNLYLNAEEMLDILARYSVNGKIEEPENDDSEIDRMLAEEYLNVKLDKQNGALEILYDSKEEPKIKYGGKDYYRIPPEVTIKRVSKNVLGPGVLGVAYPGQKLVMVLDSLYGEDKSEVMAHEALHIMSPLELEKDIRGWTKQKLSYARYQ